MQNQRGSWQADLLLLITAIIWGFGFVAQRAGMDHVGPFTYNAARFLLGGLCLIPLSRWGTNHRPPIAKPCNAFSAGTLAGLVLFVAANLQQIGIQFTTAGKAGFITGLYVVFVPILGIITGQRTGKCTWIGALLAAYGMYLLSVQGTLQIATGDLLVLFSAVFWALHVLVLGFLSPRTNPIRLARDQFFLCSLLSMGVAVLLEEIDLRLIIAAAIPILYGGLISVGAGYTLQVVAQQRAEASHAAILLSLEAVFAALGGWLLLGEQLTLRATLGCCFMLGAMFISQLRTCNAAAAMGKNKQNG
jgi:drug/metabolite transporter (DMT)-like permease